MKIETKFDIGQEIWFIFGYDKTVENSTIQAIEIINNDNGNPRIWYVINNFMGIIPEAETFNTQEEAEEKLREMSK